MQTGLFFPGGVIGSLLGGAAFSRPSPIQISARSDRDSADRKSGVIQGQVFGAEGVSASSTFPREAMTRGWTLLPFGAGAERETRHSLPLSTPES